MPSVHSKDAVAGMRQQLQDLEESGLAGLKKRAKLVVTYGDAILVLKIELGSIFHETKKFLKKSKLKLTFADFLKSEEYCNNVISSSEAGKCIDVFLNTEFLKQKFGDDFANRISMNKAVNAVYAMRKANKEKLDAQMAQHDNADWVTENEEAREEKEDKKADNRAKRELDKKATEEAQQEEIDTQHAHLEQLQQSIEKTEDAVHKVQQKLGNLKLKDELNDALLHTGEAKKTLATFSESLPPASKPVSKNASKTGSPEKQAKKYTDIFSVDPKSVKLNDTVETGDELVQGDQVGVGVTPDAKKQHLGVTRTIRKFASQVFESLTGNNSKEDSPSVTVEL